MPHSLTQETQFDYVVFVFEIAQMETIQTDIINYEQYHLDIPVDVFTRIIKNLTIQKPLWLMILTLSNHNMVRYGFISIHPSVVIHLMLATPAPS